MGLGEGGTGRKGEECALPHNVTLRLHQLFFSPALPVPAPILPDPAAFLPDSAPSLPPSHPVTHPTPILGCNGFPPVVGS
jgi:hypothetical protein